ncbi:hypothetical protein V2E29_04235 [Streptomyces diastatochromogenes]|uniref:hypothetical protein n=1 Tax=Streptomyces diastatochromogenes TaxID=42236 RepID=UPI002F264CA6
MTTLPARVDWGGNERPASAMEMARAEGTATRIRREVAEISFAAGQLAAGNPFEAAVAEFLTTQATMLERAGSSPQRADSMRREEDTLDEPGTFPTAARSALLIARAHLRTK